MGLHRRGDSVYPRPQATGQTKERETRQSAFRRRDVDRDRGYAPGERLHITDHHGSVIGSVIGAVAAQRVHIRPYGDGRASTAQAASPACSWAGWNITTIRSGQLKDLPIFLRFDWRSYPDRERSAYAGGGFKPAPSSRSSNRLMLDYSAILFCGAIFCAHRDVIPPFFDRLLSLVLGCSRSFHRRWICQW